MRKLYQHILFFTLVVISYAGLGQSTLDTSYFPPAPFGPTSTESVKISNAILSDATCGIDLISSCDGNGTVYFELTPGPLMDITEIDFNGTNYDTDTTTKIFATGLCNNQLYTGFIRGEYNSSTLVFILIQVTLDGSPSIEIIESIQNESCSNESDGQINLNITGGTPFGDGSYDVAWDHGPTDTLITGLAIDDYGFLVTDSAGCTGSDTLTITSGDTIQADFSYLPATACAGDTTTFTDASFSSNGTINYNWNFGALGSPTNSVSPGPVAVVFGSGVSETVSLTVDNGSGCSDDTTITVTINQVSSIDLNTFSDTCVNETPFILTGGSPSSGGTGIYSGPGVNSGTGTFDPAAATAGTHTIYYNFTDGTTGCSATDSAEVTVDALPAVSLGAIPDICENATTYTLTEGAPGGGTYSGTNVNSGTGTFDPTGLNGSIDIIYTITNAAGCPNSDTNTITVNGLPTVSLAGVPNFCENDGPYTLIEGTPGGGSYLGTGVSGGQFDPSTGAGIYTIQYTSTNGSGCSDTASQNIEVFALPTPTMAAIPDICENNGNYTLIEGGGGGLGGTYLGTSVSAGTFDPTIGAGTYTVGYELVSGSGGCRDTAFNTVTVNALPSLNIPNDTLICLFDTVDFTSSGANSFEWTDLGTGANFHSLTNIPTVAIEATSTTDIQVIGTTLSGCTDTVSFEIDVLSPPIVSPKGDTAICAGDTIQMQAAAGMTSYLWTPSTELSADNTQSPLAFPSTTRRYYIDVVGGNTCTNRDSVLITVVAAPTADATNDTTICANEALQLDAYGSSVDVTNYIWTPNTDLSNDTIVNPVATPTGSITYQVKVFNAIGCADSAEVDVTVNAIPSLSVSNDTAICIGDTATLIASGAATYLWSAAAGNIINAANPTTGAHPVTDQTYQVVGSNGQCTDTAFVDVIVNDLPAIIVSRDDTICFNDTVQITASGGNDYVWTPAGTLSDPNISNPNAFPTSTTQYIVAVTDGNNCSDTASINIIVRSLITVTVPNDTTICFGDTALLAGAVTNATTIAWTSGAGANIDNGSIANTFAIPAGTLTYTLSGSNDIGCTVSDSLTVNVTPLPVVTITPDTTMCQGDTLLLTSSGGTTYLWSSAETLIGSTANDSIQFTSVAGGNINLTVSSGAGCAVDTGLTVTTLAVPTVTLTPDTAICNGDTIQLQAGGGTAYDWSTNPTDLSGTNIDNPNAFPSTDQTYTVRVSIGGGACFKDSSVTVAVNTIPTLTISNDTAICLGDTVAVTLGGAPNVNWTPNDATVLSANTSTTQIVPNAAGLVIYQAVGTSAQNCSDSLTVDIITNALPTVTALKDTTLCFGDSTTLSASGAVNYTWNSEEFLNDSTSATPVAIPDAGLTSFTVIGTDLLGCSSSDTVDVTVEAEITISVRADTTICSGDSLQLTPTVTGATIFSWTSGPNGIVDDGVVQNTFGVPSDTSVYTFTGSHISGCSVADSFTVNVDNSPAVTLNPDFTMCEGDTVTINATGGVTYTWSSSETIIGATNIDSLIITSSTGGTVDVTIGTAAGCTIDTGLVVTAVNAPIVTITPDTAICIGDTLELLVTGGTIYDWSANPTNLSATNVANPEANPSTDQTYYVTISLGSSCVANDSVTVTVNALPTIGIAPDTTICLGDTVNIAATGANSYSWSPNDATVINPSSDNTDIVPAVLGTVTYTVTGTSLDNCLAEDSVRVTAQGIPSLSVSNDTTLCFGDSITLQASGAVKYTWDSEEFLNDSTSATPVASPDPGVNIFIVFGEAGNGCTDQDTVVITVENQIDLSVGNDTTVCQGDTALLNGSVTGALTFGWTSTQLIDDATSLSTFSVPTDTAFYVLSGTNATVGCEVKDSILVEVNNFPEVTVSNDTTVCDNQTVVLTASGGTSYLWTSTIAIPDNTNDTIVVNVGDTTIFNLQLQTISGCIADTSVTINTTTSPFVEDIADTTICEGSTYNVATGSPLTIDWSSTTNGFISNASNISLSPTSDETFTLSVSSGINCASTDTFTVSVQSLPTLVINAQTDSICSNEDDSLIVTGANTYTWSPFIDINTLVNDSVIVSPNTSRYYYVTGVDAVGCSSTDSIFITSLVTPTITTSINQSICEGSSVSILATGGSAYSWTPDNGSIDDATKDTIVVSPDSTTTYTVQVSNAQCTETEDVIVTVNDAPTGTFVPSHDTLCLNSSTYSHVALDVGILADPFGSFSFDNASTFSTLDSNFVSGTVADTYTDSVTIRDIFGCTAVLTTNIEILDEVTFEIDTIAYPDCVGPPGEFKLINVQGGINPYTINFDGFITADTSTVFSNVNPGSYPLSITDGFGCIVNSIIDFNNILDFDTSFVEPTCFGSDNGSILISNVSGGSAPYEFSLNNNLSYTSDSIFDTLSANSYTVFVKDASGCEIPVSLTLTEPSELSLDLSNLGDQSCSYLADGSYTVEVNGGTLPYITHSPTDTTGDTLFTVTNSLGGNFQYSVTDVNNCVDTLEITINAADTLNGFFSQGNNLSDCMASDAEGQIDSVTGGSAFYSFSINSGVSYHDSSTFVSTQLNGLSGGTYQILTLDMISGCQDTTLLFIGDDINLDSVEAVTSQPTCKQDDGTVTLSGTEFITAPAVINYGLYVIDDITLDTTEVAPFQLVASFSDLVSGNYFISIRDGNLCEYTYPFDLQAPAVLDIQEEITPANCGLDNATITMNTTGGIGPFIYEVENEDNGEIIRQVDDLFFDSLAAGDYRISVEDTTNPDCFLGYSVVVPLDQIQLTISTDSAICSYSNDGIMEITSTSGDNPVAYTYEYAVDDSLTFSTTTLYTNLTDGIHQLYIKQTDTANNICIFAHEETYFDVTIDSVLYDTISIESFLIEAPDSLETATQIIPSDKETPNGEIIIDSIYGSIAGYTYELSGDQNIATIDYVHNGTNGFSPLAPGEYLLTITDSNNCFLEIEVDLPINFYIPNIFTPNFDGKNDYFTILNVHGNTSIVIYDRWGNLVYENDDYLNDWDGGKEPDGVYFYEITTETNYAKGWVQIVR